MHIAAAGVGFVAQVHELEAVAEILPHCTDVDAVVKIHAEEAVSAFKYVLCAADAAPRELDRHERRLCRKCGLESLHQRGVARDLMIAGGGAVDNAERIQHL